MQIDREIDIMKLIDHPHCIKLLDVYKSTSHIYMVLELMSGGELFDRIIAKVCPLKIILLFYFLTFFAIFGDRNTTLRQKLLRLLCRYVMIWKFSKSNC